MVDKFVEDEVVVDQLLRLVNVGRATNVDSFLSWHAHDLQMTDPWLVKDRILPPSSFSYPVWYLSASLVENVKDDDELRQKICVMAQGTSLSIAIQPLQLHQC